MRFAPTPPTVRAARLSVVLGASAIVIAILTQILGSDVEHVLVLLMFINMILVVGLYLFSGTSGILQFGHLAYMGVGAYTSVLLTIPPSQKSYLYATLPSYLGWLRNTEVGFFPATLIGGTVAAIAALILAVPLMRLSGPQAGIASFAVLAIGQGIWVNWTAVTKGLNTVVGVPQYTTLVTTVAWAIVAIVVAAFLQESRHGLRLRASRDNHPAAQALGIRVPLERGIAYVISAFFMGVAGVLYAHFFTVFGPDAFYITLTFLTVLMLVVGGMTSLTGAFVGVCVITVISEVLRRIEVNGLGPINTSLPGLTALVQSCVLLAILILRPRGLTNGRETPLSVKDLRALGRRLRVRGAAGEADAGKVP